MGCVCSTERRRRHGKVVNEGETAWSEDDPIDQLDPIDSPSREGSGKISELNNKIFKVFGGNVPNLSPIKKISGQKFQGTKITILAFEVANTIGKAANLMQSLSDENMQFLKSVILSSQGVRKLVSQDPMHLLMIVASDQREEFKLFSTEVVRFGNLCKDSQWHNLEFYFQKMDLDPNVEGRLKQEATIIIQHLVDLAQHTCELYHELNILDRIEMDYKRKLLEEESMPTSLRGEGLVIYHTELKRQQKLIKSLKNTSLWSKNLNEIVAKLIEVVRFLNHATFQVFDLNGAGRTGHQAVASPQSLGACGLALHYANIINQITNIMSRPLSFNQNTRDTFYQGLPVTVKAALRSRLQQSDTKAEMSSAQIKAEMHKILQWLSPLAESTIKANQSFGWVGDFTKAGIEFSNTVIYTRKTVRIQTLHHANKEKTEELILQLVTWLHHLLKQVKECGYGGLKNVKPTCKHPFHKDGRQSPQSKALPPSPMIRAITQSELSPEERDMLEHAENKRSVLRRSKSLDSVGTKEKREQVWSSSKSNGGSPSRDFSSDLGSNLKWARMHSVHGLEEFN